MHSQPTLKLRSISLKYIKVKEVIVIGWTLRGRIVIEMLDQLTRPEHATSKLGIRMRGLMIVGTRPSLGVEGVQDGFTRKGRAFSS